MLGNRAQHLRPSLRTAVEIRDELVALSLTQWIAGIRIQRVDELRVARRSQSIREALPLHKLIHESILIVFQLLLPVPLADDHALTDGLRIRQKLIQTNDRH